MGTRENAKGLDLNRDYMKLDSVEARALVGLMTRWDPHVAIDLHTTNGSYHGYHLTYSPTLNPNADARLIGLARDRILPAVQQAVAAKHKFRTYYYGNFASESGVARESPRVDPANPGDTIWRTFDHRPRFGNNYVGLRNRLAILSEAYSYLDFKGRVRVTEVFVEEALTAVAATASRLMILTSQLDGEAKALKGEFGVEFRIQPLSAPVDILVGDVEKRLNPRSGREMLLMGDKAVPVRMKDFGTFAATRTLSLPRGWLMLRPDVDSGRYAAALDRLRWHGLQVQRVAAESTAGAMGFLIKTVARTERPFQGHHEARLTGRYEPRTLIVPEGSLFIPATQPLARLAFYLLEPESDDGLVNWNLIESGLTPGATYPVYRMTGAEALTLTP